MQSDALTISNQYVDRRTISRDRLGDGLISAPFFAIILLTPLVSAVDWIFVYVFYAAMIGLALLTGRINLTRLWPLVSFVVIKDAFLLMLLMYHGATTTTLNGGSIIFTDIVFILYFSCFNWNINGLDRVFRFLLRSILWALAFGFVFSATVGRYFGFLSPIDMLEKGERLRLLVRGNLGHSMLNDYALVGLVLVISNVVAFSRRTQIIIGSILSVTLLLTGASAVVGQIGLIFVAYLLYKYVKNGVARWLIVLLTLLPLGYVSMSVEMNEVLRFVRVDIMGKSVHDYRGQDFSAGRAELNQAILDRALQDPIAGQGNDDPVLMYGLRWFDASLRGGAVARSETSLRIALKYGFIYFTFMIILVAFPVFVMGGLPPRMRIMTVGFTLTLFFTMSVESVVETPHNIQYPLYLSFVYILSMIGLVNRKRQAGSSLDRVR